MAGTLGKYRLIAELGRGGMGTVYLAVVRGPARFSKLVVVKQLRADFVGDANFTAMFLEEARLAARLHHPNIVQTNEVVCDPQDGHFMVMEYLEGASLKRVIRRLRARGDESARTLYARALLDVLSALQYAHSLRDFDGKPLNLVHRDVNPDNVFLLHTGEVKLLDFGIAKAADSTQETRVGVLKGKLHYMSPEQMAGDDIDCRGDIFAVGTMLWDALTGRRLWDGMKGLDIMSALARGSIASPRSVQPDVPEELDRICARALALQPADRYPDAGSFRAELQRAFGDNVMSSAELATAMSAEYLEEQERMRALIAEQLQALDETPMPSVSSLAAKMPFVNLNTDVSSRLAHTRDALALQTNSTPHDSKPSRRRVPLLAAATALLLVSGLGAAGAWALRSHVIIVNTAPGASSSSPVGPPAVPQPTAVATYLPTDRAPAPPAPANPADSPEGRSLGHGRRAVRREPSAVAAAQRPLSSAERAGSAATELVAPPVPPTTVAGISAPPVVTEPLAALASPAHGPNPAPPAAAAPQASLAIAPGTIPADAVDAVINAHYGEIQRCFDRAQMDQLYLKVRVDMYATIAPDGHVARVTTSASRDGTSRLQACIREAVQGWTFPAPAGGVSGLVKKPFVFE